MKKFKIKIYAKILIVDTILVVALSQLIPLLSGYPEYSEDANFQRQLETLSHTEQYILFGVIAAILHFVFFTFLFKDIFKFLKEDEENKKQSKATIKKIREECFSINSKIIAFQAIGLAFVLSLLLFNSQITVALCIKFILIYSSFGMSAIMIYLMTIKGQINSVIRKTYKYYDEIPLKSKRTGFHRSLIVNLVPFFFIIIVICSLHGYTKVCEQLGESYYYYYNLYLNNIDFTKLTYNELIETLDEIPLKNAEDYYLIMEEGNMNEDDIYFSSQEGYASEFFLLYLENYSDLMGGRVYEYFGVEEQAYVMDVKLATGEKLTVGFKYSNTSVETMIYFAVIAALATVLMTILVYFWAKSTSSNIVEVSNGMKDIATNENPESMKKLPVLERNEIGELAVSFNQIQEMTANHIKQIQDNRETLMETERLAALGQLIGGIAHNLKTPIMSISGASEGLKDLITEYDNSIDNPNVNSQDHHEIAKEMESWVSKIKTHTEYMSDVITTVKGQAVQMSNTENRNFTIEELLKSVNILMKHELKNSIIYLNVYVKTDEGTTIKGDINSLIQVINNMISNSIQSYEGKTEQTINLIVERDENNLLISIEDHGKGMTEDVKKKLFKEMVTTKGKNGTGIGLYMSYSTIKANFNGDIEFESEEGKGTTFTIILPLK